MTTQHTPGPWHYRSSAHSKTMFGLSIFTDGDGLIADLSGRYKQYRTEAEIHPTTKANAALLAAAPDLLAALQAVADYWEGGDVPAGIDAAMRAALKKAKGSA